MQSSFFLDVAFDRVPGIARETSLDVSLGKEPLFLSAVVPF